MNTLAQAFAFPGHLGRGPASPHDAGLSAAAGDEAFASGSGGEGLQSLESLRELDLSRFLGVLAGFYGFLRVFTGCFYGF